MTAWERVRQVRASDEIVRQIRKAIFEDALKAGDLLGSENQLAAQFGVSRNTMRDALRALEATGAVEIRSGVKGGVRVAQPDPNRFADGLAVHLKLVGADPADATHAELGLEWVAAELAAEQATPQDLSELRVTLDAAEHLLDSGPAFAEASQAFHDGVARASRNWAIIAGLRAIRELMGKSRAQHATPEVARRVQAAHRSIFQAISNRDAEAASLLMRQHISPIRDSTARRKQAQAELRDAAR